LNKILTSKNIAVISHANPDCDALGSLLGVYFALKIANLNVYAVNVGPLHKKFDFLPGFELLQTQMPADVDLIIALDCGKFSRLGIERQACEIINIDHHLSNENYGSINVIDAKAPSASAVAYDFLVKNGFAIPKESASCFYAALLADSGCFCYDVVTQQTFELAAKLVELGANPGLIGKGLTQRQSIAQVKLQAKVFDKILFYKDERLAAACVSQNDFISTNADILDADGFADKARALNGVELGMCLRELDNGFIRGSFRSKSFVNTTIIANEWGGGGHYHASGFECKIDNNFEIDSKKIINRVQNLFLEQLGDTKGDIK
jgi:phosphoesterase RecJ-like protein